MGRRPQLLPSWLAGFLLTVGLVHVRSESFSFPSPDDPEGAFVPPEFDVTGNTFEVGGSRWAPTTLTRRAAGTRLTQERPLQRGHLCAGHRRGRGAAFRAPSPLSDSGSLAAQLSSRGRVVFGRMLIIAVVEYVSRV